MPDVTPEELRTEAVVLTQDDDDDTMRTAGMLAAAADLIEAMQENIAAWTFEAGQVLPDDFDGRLGFVEALLAEFGEGTTHEDVYYRVENVARHGFSGYSLGAAVSPPEEPAECSTCDGRGLVSDGMPSPSPEPCPECGPDAAVSPPEEPAEAIEVIARFVAKQLRYLRSIDRTAFGDGRLDAYEEIECRLVPVQESPA